MSVQAASPQLTPRQRVEREFGPPPSRARGEFQSERAITASVHSSGTPQASDTEPPPPSSVSSGSAPQNEASQAARRFGQP
jgi:hypothetical protein